MDETEEVDLGRVKSVFTLQASRHLQTCCTNLYSCGVYVFVLQMSMETGRRQIVQAGVAAAVAAPLLRANPAAAGMDKVSADAACLSSLGM